MGKVVLVVPLIYTNVHGYLDQRNVKEGCLELFERIFLDDYAVYAKHVFE